jgi:ATP-dependent RNA helicase SUPV3L1/SUV3
VTQLDVDLSEPHTWFPHARAMRRQVHLHIGPTNSGKTHTALKALQEAGSGWYAGPLRLLAWEVHDALMHNKKGHARGPVPCNLLTGQEIERLDGAQHTASTVEMADVLDKIDVAVVDEIQMIGCSQRGWAWTRAVLGMPAHELHLCGDPSATDLIRRMCELTGDELHIHEYQRLSPLLVQDSHIANLAPALQPGDCVVAFSKAQLFQLKQDVGMQGRARGYHYQHGHGGS